MHKWDHAKAQEYAALAQQYKEAATGVGEAIAGIYAYGSKLPGFDNASIIKAVFNIEHTSVLKDSPANTMDFDIAKLVNQLTSAINAFENKSFSEGDCLNVYLGHLGLGAVIGLYTPSTQA